MTYWDDFHDETGRRDQFAATTPSVRYLTGTDLLLLAGFALLAFLAFDDFTAAAGPTGQFPAVETPQRQQICSEEELRHMRSGWDTCFDQPTSDASDPQAEPSLSSFQGS